MPLVQLGGDIRAFPKQDAAAKGKSGVVEFQGSRAIGTIQTVTFQILTPSARVSGYPESIYQQFALFRG
jgi:hypothetical protein